MRRAAKVDANHGEIVAALQKIGASVQSLAQIGQGCPDVLVAFRNAMFLLEIKSGKGKPNELQKRWHITWCAPVHVVYTPDDALRAIGAVA